MKLLKIFLLSCIVMVTGIYGEEGSRSNILWHNSTTGAVKFMPINNMIPENTLPVVDSSNTNLLPKGMGDFTGEGKPDILFHNQNSGNLRIWEMDGTTKVNNILVLGSSNTNLKIAGVGDFDQDGDNDIATFNTNSGALRMWVMDGAVRVNNVLVLTGANTNLVPRGAGDMDGDGIPDIVLRNNNSGAVRIWTMNSDFTRKGNEYIRSSSNTNLELRGVVDINRDGNNDILNYNISTGMLRAWIMDGYLSIIENATITQEADLKWSVRGGAEEISIISIIAKNLDVPITDPLTKLSYEITSKYDIGSFQVKINNVDRTELATLKDKVLVIEPTPASSLPFDYLITTLILTDERGRIHTETFSYKVDLDVSISAGFSAEPQIGYAPLEVTFSPKVNADESIQLYHWDFGDGTKNDSNTSRENLIGTPVKHTYKEEGEYTVVLTIYDSTYQPATSQLVVKIYNQPPVVTRIEVSPSNGDFPLKSSFSATATDSEGIREFLWDFNNDGQIDFNDSKINVENPDYIAKYASSYASYTYEKEGKYQGSLRVVDINGAITEISTPTISVLVGPEGTPTVTARAYPTSGEAPLLVSFSSYNPYNTSKWEWDFNGDGIFDHSSTTTGSVDHNYTVAGNYFAKLQVTNSDGLKSSDSIEITMGQNISLTRDTDTIDIKNDQSVGLDVTVAGETDTKLLVEDNKYQAIKTLLDWKRRSGTFSTIWDGTDSEGSIVPEGDYYIILLYKEAGEIKRFDLRTERVNVYKPITTNVKAGDVFAPYLEPMMIEFNLTEASEVSLDIGPDGTSVTERIKTLLLKEPLGKGSHTIVWAGDANDGTLADLSLYKEKYPSDADFYMTGGFMSKLADNAVFVKSGVSVLNLKSDAPVYVPNAIGEDEKRKSLTISFDLTASASVVLTVNDAKTGATVMSKHVASLAKGSQVIKWDGKDADGKYIAPGVYRIGVKATDSYGYTSLTQYALQRIFY